MPVIRRGEPADLPEVAAIQAASAGSAQWNVADYLLYDFQVAILHRRIAGFLVSRALAEGEREVLNLAVAPEFRRRSVARNLVRSLISDLPGAVYLEVRESNTVARKFYKSLGFQEVGVRHKYYESPPEPAIVMKFHSC